jgi:hypothetical protein
MEKAEYEYICKRCEEVLLSNPEYLKLERSGADEAEIQEAAEVIIYQAGRSDMIKEFIRCLL